MQQRSLPPRAVPATGFRRAPLEHALPVLTAPALRHLHRAHAACIATQHAPCRCVALSLCCGCKDNSSGTPRARASAEAAAAGCARGNCLSSPQPSREHQRYAPSSPPARKRSFVRCGRRSIQIPSFASPREVHPTVRCQRSSRRTGQRGLTAGLPPPRAGLPATFTPPWGSATSRRCALGSLLWPHPPPRGTRCAAGSARCTDSFNVSGQAEGSIVTP